MKCCKPTQRRRIPGMNLILLEPSELDSENRVLLTDHRALHVREVLKTESGQTVRVGCTDGPLGTGAIESDTAQGILLHCTFQRRPPPRPRIDLLLALPRPKVMKRLWAPLASLGVGRIILTAAWKVERNYFDTHVIDPSFYTPLLKEGLQQARDTWLPRVTVHRRFKVLVEDELDTLFPAGARWMADPDAAPRQPILQGKSAAQRLLLAIGPEGGWTDYERDLLRAHGFKAFSLGPRPLRTDIACIALLTLAHHALRK